MKPGAALQAPLSLIDSLIHKFSLPRHRHSKTVRDRSSSYKIYYVIGIQNFLNPKGHQNSISGSKFTIILLKGWILPIGGVASGDPLVQNLQDTVNLKLLKRGS